MRDDRHPVAGRSCLQRALCGHAPRSASKRENVSGRFNFEVRGPQQVLELSSPLGTTVARIEIEPGGARATGAQMQEVRGADADALTEQLLGWRLPVSGLADWIEGRPVPQIALRASSVTANASC